MTPRLVQAGILAPLFVAAVIAQTAEEYRIQPGTAVLVQVGKGGLLSFAGHDHEVSAPATEGQISLNRTEMARSSVRLVFDAAAMKVTGKGEPAEDVPEVQRVMLSDRVMDVARHPTIRFESRAVSRTGATGAVTTLAIDGDLTLHGVTRRVSVPGVQLRIAADRLTAEGRVVIKQSDFGIQPVTAAGGTVRVKDEVTVIFNVVATR